MGANELQCIGNLDSRGIIGRIYVGDHLMLLHTKYLSSGPYGLWAIWFQKRKFMKFFH